MRVGVRELKNRATAIIRNVRENHAEYMITHRGRPVALILPIDEEWLDTEAARAAAVAEPSTSTLDELEALRREIGRSWISEKSAAEIVAEQRR